jgi:hypothetical protein
MSDFTAAVTAINELHRRSFKNPPSPADWKAHDGERDINIQMLNDGDIENMDGWVMTAENVDSFINEGWKLKDREGDDARGCRGQTGATYTLRPLRISSSPGWTVNPVKDEQRSVSPFTSQ